MKDIYDLAITGAGPTGLMAAKTAAEKGLKVIVIERKKDISKIRRACCAHFILDDDYENEEIHVKNGKIIFTKNGFEVNYTGQTLNLVHKYFVSPKGHRIHFAHKDGRPYAIKFDKGVLLKGLWEECENCGVEFRLGTIAYKANDHGKKGVEIHVTQRGIQSTIKAARLIDAGGVNALITGSCGMNKDRKLFSIAFVNKFIVEGKRVYAPEDYNLYYGRAFHTNGAVIMDPSLYGDKVFEVMVLGNRKDLPSGIFPRIRNDSPLAPLFEGSKIIDIHTCSLKAFTSLMIPYKGNVLSCGDSAAYVEVEVQGALMCGYHGGNAVARELNGEDGFKEYTEWWQKTFEFNSNDYLKVAQGYALVPYYSDDELDYLFSLTEDQVLEGTNSQYKTPKLFWPSILRHREKINKEKPELIEKINKIDTMTLSTSF
jgi:digeranylgeranylglycerophospholipid reductase